MASRAARVAHSRRDRASAYAEAAASLTLLQDDPTRLWRPAEIAAHFGDITLHTMYRQLSRWAGSGLIHTLGPGLYSATAWTSTPLPPAQTG